MKCFYHADNDGRLSAALVAEYNQKKGKGCHPNDFVEMNYDKPFPIEDISDGEEVWIVDYHIPVKMMWALHNITTNIVFIDHHDTAIKEYVEAESEYFKDTEKSLPVLPGYLDTRYSACLLTWLFTNDFTVDEYEDGLVDVKIPEVVQFVDSWDCWRFDKVGTRKFHAGSQLYDTHPLKGFWHNCLYSDPAFLTNTMKEGRTVLKFKKQFSAEYAQKNMYFTFFDSHLCIAMNIGMINSDWFHSVPSKGVDIFIATVFDGDSWTVSLYSTGDVDVGKIAKNYGGGGHLGAAGFVCKELPFEKVHIKESKEKS